uniref:Mediator of RNA polymerase II transcription subunit 24 n=1 Tax=Saccoglossus kowalevskii TaxID=10224 RepID=A0ABM0MSC1_SACKO
MEMIKQKQMILKSLLLKAWRERWSDVQWSAQVKAVLPKGTSGDVYNLAETWKGIEQVLTSIRNTLINQQQTVFTKELREKVDRYLVEIQKLQNQPISPIGDVAFGSKVSSCTINIMTYMEAVLNITIDIQPFVDQVVLIESIQKLHRATVYLELMRASLIGVVDAAGSSDELKWASFTYLKLPQILMRLQSLPPSDGSKQDNSEILNQSFEQLLRFVPLLDAADTKSHCDSLQYLLQELVKHGLMSDVQVRKIHAKRTQETQKTKSTDTPPTQPNASLILRADPTVKNILK